MPKQTDRARPETPSVDQRLARLLDTPHLARIVPQLAPETLHQLIRYRGLDASTELVAAATPAQLTSVFDIDLWRHPQPGRDQQFDAERFGEWLEALVDAGDDFAARTIASLDESLVVTGLSRYIRVLDPGVFLPHEQSDDEPMAPPIAPSGDSESELGGYLVRARKADSWDAIIALLTALETGHPKYFHAVMQGCRQLSNSTPEIDGLDDLLMAPEQQLHDVAVDRDDRRTERGYATPAEARAFLQMARRPRAQRSNAEPTVNPIAAAYFRAGDEAAAAAAAAATASATPPEEHATQAPVSAEIAESIEAVVDLMAEAGLVPPRPRALLDSGAGGPSRHARMESLMERLRDTDEAAYFTRGQELAFLANTLMAGCSVQSRPFTVQEAHDAAVSVCNLGLEQWPAGASDAETPDLVTAFEAGWALLHEQVSMFVATNLIVTLIDLPSIDEGIQDDLKILRRALVKQRDAGTPWLAAEALEVIQMLDTTAWASLHGLLGECPVLPAALTAILTGHTRTVSPTAFEFISTADQIGEVRTFMGKLAHILLG